MDDRKMAFTEHLRELRTRLRNSIIALILAICVTYFFAEPLYALLCQPYIDAYRQNGLGEAELAFASLTEPFWVYFKVAMYAGVFVASPVIFHQLWSFIAPGLYSKEKRIALGKLLSSRKWKRPLDDREQWYLASQITSTPLIMETRK